MFGALESHAEGMLWIAPRDAKGDVDFELSLASTGDKVVLRESSDEFFFVRGPGGLSGSHGSHGLHCDRDFASATEVKLQLGSAPRSSGSFQGSLDRMVTRTRGWALKRVSLHEAGPREEALQG